MPALPRYPVYIPSKGRYAECLTAQFLIKDKVPFHIVVEPQEAGEYTSRFGSESVLTLPWDNPGSVIPARNWIKEHATAQGYERHWQIDDNCTGVMRIWKGRKMWCPAGAGLALTEDFVDRYENVAVAGLNYEMFISSYKGDRLPPFTINRHVYSCTLTLNSLPYRWRGRYNEDADYCLQALAGGWCTLLMNTVVIKKTTTMMMGGGNTETLYQNDGRLNMAKSLERQWPGVVRVRRRWGRPQHVLDWTKFDTPLKRRADVEIPDEPNEYGMVLRRVKPKRNDSTNEDYVEGVLVDERDTGGTRGV